MLGTYIDKENVTHHITEIWKHHMPGFYWIRTLEANKPLQIYTTDIELCQNIQSISKTSSTSMRSS